LARKQLLHDDHHQQQEQVQQNEMQVQEEHGDPCVLTEAPAPTTTSSFNEKKLR